MTPDLPPEIEVHGWLEAGIEVPADPELQPAATIDLARLQTVLDSDWYGGALQVDAASETSKLLDAMVRLGPKKTFELRAGLFKTPLSLDFGVPAPKLVLPSRALLVGAATRREIGAEVLMVRGPVKLQLGAFDPLSDFERTGPGVRPIGAVDWELVEGLSLHMGASAWLRERGSEARVGPDGPAWDELADLGLEYATEQNTLMLEGLVGSTVADGTWEGGAAVEAAHRFPVSNTELEPAVGWDSANLGGALVHRGSTALNLHLNDWFAVARISGEVFLPTETTETELLGRAQVQVGF